MSATAYCFFIAIELTETHALQLQSYCAELMLLVVELKQRTLRGRI